jgi:hypothetical protein
MKRARYKKSHAIRLQELKTVITRETAERYLNKISVVAEKDGAEITNIVLLWNANCLRHDFLVDVLIAGKEMCMLIPVSNEDDLTFANRPSEYVQRTA